MTFNKRKAFSAWPSSCPTSATSNAVRNVWKPLPMLHCSRRSINSRLASKALWIICWTFCRVMRRRIPLKLRNSALPYLPICLKIAKRTRKCSGKSMALIFLSLTSRIRILPPLIDTFFSAWVCWIAFGIPFWAVVEASKDFWILKVCLICYSLSKSVNIHIERCH